MEFRVLGPLEVSDGGEAPALGGPRQRLVLALLILEANRVVATERLIDKIWGDEPPDSARATLFAYISRLRKLLGAARIQARPPGYVLVAERDEIDMLRFTDLLQDASRHKGDPAAVAALLTEALDLWRGGALSDLADHEAILPSVTHLEDLRLSAIEDRVEAEMEQGHHRQSVPVLESLTIQHPLRERIWSQLILALYRSGRQGDALTAFHRARRMLVEELGIDPSPELRVLHEQVLRQDPALDLPSSAAAAPAPAPVVSSEVMPAALPSGGPSTPTRRLRSGVTLAAAIAVPVVAAVAAALLVSRGTGVLPAGEWKVGVDMPLTGSLAVRGQQTRDAVRMAVDDLNQAAGINGTTLGLLELDDAHIPELAEQNASLLVTDATVLAMVGPWGSVDALRAIPVTNAAGLLECSPSSTLPNLTKPRHGALDLRAARPDDINFIRLAPSDDIQAIAMASFAYRDLAATYALVIDDGVIGRDIAQRFADQFEGLGGSTVRRTLNPGADPQLILTALSGSAEAPGLVFFGGSTNSGAAILRDAMGDLGHRSVPLLSWDGLLDGSGAIDGSYIDRVGGEVASGTYAAHASLPDAKFSFADSYRTRFGEEADEYAAAAYACVEIIYQSLRATATEGASPGQLRELARAYAADPDNHFETVVGTVGFDANGDALQQFVTFYKVERSAALGAGDWVIFKKQDFGPAP